ncbi:uncharacterized protein LOC110032988 isoform X4 [Phalaenopsis equestris]|uniref:uncharacterized protein LOC110032988 isoform X4 n=1 Tax=Phalaenopsis equestris TaxID=78828 RepID=UPI0009E2704B|nr:uncharacterized protein LOC110032988 isoform X4 [Phalaenopsis equestris]
MMELVEEVNFALYGFRPWRPVRIRRTCLLSLLNICSREEGRRLIKERGMTNMIVDAILDLNFDDTVSSLGATALLYVLASDVEDDALLDSPACVRFLLKLMSLPMESVEKNTMKIDFDLSEVHKSQSMDIANKGVDSTCRAIISKVKELLSLFNDSRAGSDGDDGMKKPELSAKWIALLIIEKACLSSVSFKDMTEMTEKVWGNFKESFRELKGLDAIFHVVTDCHSTLEGWFKKKSVSVLASKDGDNASLESVVLLLKSLKIMENATFMSEDNQNYLLKMKPKSESGGVPLSFVSTIISCIRFLSGLTLRSSISSILDNGKSPLSSSGACMMENVTGAWLLYLVLMNLTNNNLVGCQQIGACGGLDTLASLIASHFPKYDLFIPTDTEIEESMTFFNRSKVSGRINDRNLNDHELDFLVAILGLLVNLVEKDSLNRLRLASARVLVTPPGTSTSMEAYRDVVPLLCSIFMSNQGAGNAAKEEEDDEASLLQSQREAEMMIIEAYTALLLAFLSTESTTVKETIARCLPNHRLEILVPVLERFVAFHLNLNMISPETHSAVVKVIESCKEP